MIKVKMTDSESGISSKVTRRGQLITAPYDYSDVSNQTLDVINTAYNFFAPNKKSYTENRDDCNKEIETKLFIFKMKKTFST